MGVMAQKYALNVRWRGKMRYVHFAGNHYTQKNYVVGIIYRYVAIAINARTAMSGRNRYSQEKSNDENIIIS